MVGNCVYITGGGSTTGWYQITSYTSGLSVTVDRAPGTATNATIHVGGCLAHPSLLCLVMVTGNKGYVKSGTYTINSNSIGISGGAIQFTGGASNILVAGYATTHGDNCVGGSRPFLQLATGVGSEPVWLDVFGVIANFTVDGNRGGGLSLPNWAFLVYGGGTLVNCVVQNCNVDGFTQYSSGGYSQFIDCYAYNCNYGFVQTAAGFICHGCVASGCTNDGFNVDVNAIANCNFCISINNGGNGFLCAGNGIPFSNCAAYNNTLSGFTCTSNTQVLYQNCISVSNGSYGFQNGYLNNCAVYGNGTNTSGQSNFPNNSLTLTGSPFVSASTGNFALNNTSGAGAACRAAGFPGAFPGISTTGYLDIGAAQHQASGGGGGANIVGSSAIIGPIQAVT
jgi:hypothetical protein